MKNIWNGVRTLSLLAGLAMVGCLGGEISEVPSTTPSPTVDVSNVEILIRFESENFTDLRSHAHFETVPNSPNVEIVYTVTGSDGYTDKGRVGEAPRAAHVIDLPYGYYSRFAPQGQIPGHTWLQAEYTVRAMFTNGERTFEETTTRWYPQTLEEATFGALEGASAGTMDPVYRQPWQGISVYPLWKTWLTLGDAPVPLAQVNPMISKMEFQMHTWFPQDGRNLHRGQPLSQERTDDFGRIWISLAAGIYTYDPAAADLVVEITVEGLTEPQVFTLRYKWTSLLSFAEPRQQSDAGVSSIGWAFAGAESKVVVGPAMEGIEVELTSSDGQRVVKTSNAAGEIPVNLTGYKLSTKIPNGWDVFRITATSTSTGLTESITVEPASSLRTASANYAPQLG